jgi:hypothetical protein
MPAAPKPAGIFLSKDSGSEAVCNQEMQMQAFNQEKVMKKQLL